MKSYKILMGLLLAITLTACSNKQTAIHDEDAHEENLQLTVYSETFEVYAEAKPFVAGQESDILAHFSFLKNFKPITEAKITASLIVGNKVVKQTLDKPTRTGIYSYFLTPSIVGMGKIIFDIETPDGKSQIVVPNVQVYKDMQDAQHAAVVAVVSSSNGAMFTKEQSWKLDFATEEARLEPFGQIIRATAQILPAQGDQRVVAAKAGGLILFSDQEIVEGKTVGAGQSLFSIESEGMADNNLSVRFSEVSSDYKRAKAEYERKKDLAKDNIVSQSELLKVQAEYSNAEAAYNNLRKNFSSGRQVISSPITGYISQVLVRNGQYVEPGQAVIVVSQNKDLLIKAELQPKYYSFLSDIISANFVISNSNLKYTLEELNGRVISFGKSTDLDNPLIPVVFQVKNSVGLLPGSFIELYIKTQRTTQAITIPKESILEEMGNYFVYTQLTPEYFEKRTVIKGVTDGYRTEIIEGVSVGDRVVSKGAILVKLAQATGTLDTHSGHIH